MKRYKQTIVLVFSLCFISGCWDRTEVNDLAFVTATGIDLVDENNFLVSIQAPLPGAMGGPGGGGGGTAGDKPFYVDAGTGRNVREANDDLQKRMSRELYFAHRRVLIIGEKLAFTGIERSLDLILEHPESRLSTYILVAEGDAINMLTSSPHFEQLPGEAIRELTKAGLQLNVRDVLNQLHLPGKDPVIPMIKTIKTQNRGDDEKEEVEIEGVAVMKDDILQFKTNKDEGIGILWLLKKMHDKRITVPIDDNSELNLNISDYKVQTTFVEKNNLPQFTINLKVKSILLQNEPDLNLEDTETYRMATKKIEKLIESQIKAIIEHGKKEKVDPFGLGWHIYRSNNMLWEKHLKGHWRELLPDIKVNVKVKADIERVNNKGIKIREVT